MTIPDLNITLEEHGLDAVLQVLADEWPDEMESWIHRHTTYDRWGKRQVLYPVQSPSGQAPVAEGNDGREAKED
jgi:hypothetical protein